MKKTFCDFCGGEVKQSMTSTAKQMTVSGHKLKVSIEFLEPNDSTATGKSFRFHGDPCKKCFYEIVRDAFPPVEAQS